MRARIFAPHGLQARGAVLDDRSVLGVNHAAYAQGGQHLEGFEQRPVTDHPDVGGAGGIAEIGLETHDAGAVHRFDIAIGGVGDEPIQPEIHVAAAKRDLLLGEEMLDAVGRRVRVRHVDDGGNTPEGGRARAAQPILLVHVAGLAKMHVAVDRARQNELPRRVDDFACVRPLVFARQADRGDRAVADTDVGLVGLAFGDDGAAANHDVERVAGHGQSPLSGCTCDRWSEIFIIL